MSKKAFDKIAEGLKEAIAIARGESKPARLYIPAEIDVRAVREKLHLSQEDFASAFGFTVHQIRQWEQGRSRPLGAVRAYLIIIHREPKRVLEILRARPKGPQSGISRPPATPLVQTSAPTKTRPAGSRAG